MTAPADLGYLVTQAVAGLTESTDAQGTVYKLSSQRITGNFLRVTVADSNDNVLGSVDLVAYLSAN